MNHNKLSLIDELIGITRENIRMAEKFGEFDNAMLNSRTSPSSWSVLECVEHLNRYGDFYIPEIRRAIHTRMPSGDTEYFKPGMLGAYFVKLMKPDGPGYKKMKTFGNMNPLNAKLGRNTIEKFLDQQYKTLRLLDQARQCNLTKSRTAISISNFIKLRLGDTLRVFIYHNQRHILQAMNVLKTQQQLAKV